MIYPSQTILQNFLLCILRAFGKLNFDNSPSYYLQSNLPKSSQTTLQLDTAKWSMMGMDTIDNELKRIMQNFGIIWFCKFALIDLNSTKKQDQ